MLARLKSSFSLHKLALLLALLFLLFHLALSFYNYGRMITSALGFPFTIDYGEGPLLDQTLRLASGENIYHNDFNEPPYTISNYPPLFPLVQVPFAWIFGPALWYGRLVSLLAALAAALFLGLTLYTLTGDRLAALTGGLLLLAFPYVQFWSVLNRIDCLALGLSWAAIFVATRYTGLVKPCAPRRWAIPLAAGLFVAAIFTRQTYALAGPFAVFVWLLLMRQARLAVRLAVITGAASAVLFLVLNLATGGGFYMNIVTANVNPFYWHAVRNNFLTLWDNSVFLLVVVGLFILAERFFQQTRSWPLAAPYLLAATASGITIGKDGSNVNYLLELAAALSFAAGAALAWFTSYRGSRPAPEGAVEDAENPFARPSRRGRWLQIAIVVALAVQVGQLTGWVNGDFLNRVMNPVKQRAPLEQLLEVVRQTEGIVLADEHMALIPLAGKRLYFQPFEYKMLHEGGLWDEQPFLQAIQEDQFGLILWYTPGTWPAVESRWTPAAQRLVPVEYRLDKFTAYNKVFRPRR